MIYICQTDLRCPTYISPALVQTIESADFTAVAAADSHQVQGLKRTRFTSYLSRTIIKKSTSAMSSALSNENVQMGSVPLANGEAITWEHLEDLALVPAGDPESLTRETTHDSKQAGGCNQEMDTNSSGDESRSYHVEDVRTSTTMSEHITLLRSSAGSAGSAVFPAMFVSQTSSENFIMHHHHHRHHHHHHLSTSDTWTNAADVPTRPTSTVSQELSPLTRCPQSTLANFPSHAHNNYNGTPLEDASMSDDSHSPSQTS
ncbi:hypothetical protein VTN77DRAFT_1043 [Rasamsonia byssochlamydoides]|uniref:uncharacterized protein n=1 Tax=Rasamsonia byssochlamydoides TaxID=89139 RepID=UPI003743E98C